MSETLRNLGQALEGRYEVERELGAGGMAVVYLARDLKHDRQVALKIFRPEFASSVGPDRFLREIQLAAKLSHPHIVPLYDSGEAGGFLYYVMPYVEGESLEDRLEREGQLSMDEARQIALEVASALGYAHEQGLIHRDIKPGNIMLSRGHAVVTDFGISRALDVAGEARLTQTGSAVGTPTYMAPEQWDPSGEVDGRVDIYALGCTLYEMLVGQPPFTGSSMAAIMARHSLEAVPPPSIQRTSIDPYLEQVILKALAKTPADRFRTAAEFAKALEGSALTATTLPLRAATPASRVANRRRLAVVGVFLAGVVLAALTAWASGGSALGGILGSAASTAGGGLRPGVGGGGLPANRIVVLYFEDVTRDSSLAYLADGVTEALIGELSLVPSLDVVTRNGSLEFRESGLPVDSIARVARAGTIVSGTVEGVGDRLRVQVVLADGESGGEFRRASLERPIGDPFAIQADLAEEVAILLREWLGTEIDLRRSRRDTRSVAAWALFQRAERARKQGEERILAHDVEGFVAAFTAADSLLASAEEQDPAWVSPPALRAQLARRWGQLSAADPLEAGDWIESGIAHSERALGLDASSAEALEARGTLRYLRWALSLESDPLAARNLLSAAQADLEAAVRYDPTRANAHNVLSIIHSQAPSLVEAKLAAQRAYEEDAFLRAAEEVLWRLYATSYDLEQFPDAVEYCAEGRRRFPRSSRFVECELWLLASPAREPDVVRAWELLTQMVELSAPENRELDRLRGRVLVGGVLARTELRDSANSVFLSARPTPQVDPTQELLGLEAVFRFRMEEEAEAIRLLKLYLTASPEHRASWRWSSHWWWREFRSNDEFRQLVGLAARAP